MAGSRIAYAPNNFSWVVPGKLACMGWPQNRANMRFLENEGITRLITLSRERRPPLDDFPKSIEWTEIDVEEFKAPTVKQINEFIDICQRTHFTKEVVGVHCRQGRGRTGVMAACYLMRFQDITPEMAMINLRIMRPGSVESYEQERAVFKYHDALRGTREKRRKSFEEMEELPKLPERSSVPVGLSKYKKAVHISKLYKHTNSPMPETKISDSLPNYVYFTHYD